MNWYHGRKAAGDSYRQIQSILIEANHKCPAIIRPQMIFIVRQMATDSLEDVRTYQQGGHR